MNATDRTAWLAERRTGIGGSDIAALLGLSPWKTPLQLWMDKTGRLEETVDPERDERFYWGNVLEDVVARRYAADRGVKVQRLNAMMHHPECAIALANIDRVVVVDGSVARWKDGAVKGATNVLECKTAHAMARHSADWGEPGSDEVPQNYWLQCVWYLGITGLASADIAVLFGGQKFATYTIAADGDLFEDLLDGADHWWRRHVVADVPPEPRCEDDARRLWKSHVAGREKIVSVDVAEAVKTLASIKSQISDLEEEAQQARDRILPAFGDAEAISYMGRKLATWKQNKAGARIDWKAVAESLSDQVSPEIFALIRDENTTTTEGARVLRLNTKES